MRKLHILALCVFLASYAAEGRLAEPTHQESAHKNHQSAPPTAPLTNKDVADMLNSGLAAEIVVAKVKASACNFDTSPAALEAMKKAGIPDSVIVAMVQAPAAPAPSDRQHARVYVTDSQSWSIVGWSASHGSISTNANGQVSGSSSGYGFTTGGARPQTAEIIKTLGQRCPEVIVTNAPERADYAILLDHEGGKGLLRHKDKVAVFNKSSDSIFSASTLSLGGSVEAACLAIRKNIATKRQEK